MRSRTQYVLVVLVLCLAALTAQTGVQYKFYSAGNFPGAYYTTPLGASVAHIVGWYATSGANNAFVQTGTSFLDAAPPGSITSYLSAINVHGVAVGGFCQKGCNTQAGQYGYTYNLRTGKIRTISFPLKGAATTAYGINDKGTIVGGYCPNALACPQGAFSPASDGFIETNGVFSTLDYPGAQDTSAIAVNNSGTVVGDYIINNTGPHAFLYQNGTFTNIDYPGSNFTVASGINNYGVVAGFFTTTAGALHGFLYSNGKFTQIDRPNSPKGSGVNGINDRGDLVGLWYPSIGFPKTFKAIPVAGPEEP
jgi:probable HAF family extracellular repeat protein